MMSLGQVVTLLIIALFLQSKVHADADARLNDCLQTQSNENTNYIYKSKDYANHSDLCGCVLTACKNISGETFAGET